MSSDVAQVSELVQKIALYCDQETRKTLLTSCRSFFDFVAPLIWRDIKGAEKLFLLISGATSDPDGITLPSSISDAALERFKIYAPFVNHLELFRGELSHYVLWNWKGLLDLATADPLLPNLLSLTVSSGTWLRDVRHPQLPLLLMFVSPSLIEYRISSNITRQTTSVSRPQAVAVLSQLQRRCPKLEVLELYCCATPYSHDQELELIPQGYELSAYFRSSNLRSLSTSLAILKDIGDLGLISQIKCLEVLGPGDIQSVDELSDFQTIEWPKLQQLTLYLIDGVETFFSFWQLASLVSALTSFGLHIGGAKSHRVDISVGRVVDTLAERSPKLTHLSLCRYPSVLPRGWLDPVPVATALSKLHIQNLHIEIGDPGLKIPWLGSYLSRHAFGSIQSIDAGSYRVQLEELGFFAQSMPHLQYLRIQVRVSVSGEETIGATSSSEALELCVCYIPFDVIEPNLTWEAASK
ncbi:hypothetical protein FRC09_006522 [Ceratobasidium sp. 395]|nr:hypothetical protein FRC09_006522 [Ceratobasidium sp. 395]